jgi:osmotically-inducible protein OsmY
MAALVLASPIGSPIARAQIDPAGRSPGEIGANRTPPGGLEGSRRPGDARTGVTVQREITRAVQMPGVRADVRNGVATLNGTVASEADKQRAEQAAKRVEGVSRVRNALVVQQQPATIGDHLEQRTRAVGPSTDDAIESRLRADRRLSAHDIEVRTRDDVVTLTGEVNSVSERETAGRIAAEVAAGIEVRNQLTVRTDD